MNTCRFCGKTTYDPERRYMGMVKYGTRHYAHFDCYLEAGKPLTALHDWQVCEFPWRLLKGTDNEALAKAAWEREEARRG
jgi:hypothetical protein